MLCWAPQDSCLRFLVFLNPFRKWSPKTWAQHCVCGPQQLYRCTHCTPPRITAHGPWGSDWLEKKNEKNDPPLRNAIIKKSKKEEKFKRKFAGGAPGPAGGRRKVHWASAQGGLGEVLLGAGGCANKTLAGHHRKSRNEGPEMI